MANATKKLFQQFKDETAKTVIDENTKEKVETKGGVFTKEDIKAIHDPKAMEEVQKRYEAYGEVTPEFNAIRRKQSIAKYNLQSALDKPFATLGLITKSEEWAILGLDDAGNIVYRDTPGKNFKTRFEASKKIGRSKATVKIRDAEWQKAWDFSHEYIPELEKDTPRDTSIAQHLTTYKAFHGLGQHTDRLKYYRNLKTPEQRMALVALLDYPEQQALVKELRAAEKKEIEPLLKPSQTPAT